MKKITAIFLTVILSFCVLCGCGGKKKDKEEKSNTEQLTPEELQAETEKAEKELQADDGIIAIVGDFKVTQEYYNFMYKSIYEEMSATSTQYGEDWLDEKNSSGVTIREYLKTYTMEQIQLVVAANSIAKDYGITPESKEIKDAVKKEKDYIIEACGGEKKYADFLNDCRSSDKAVETYVAQYEIYNRVVEKLREENTKTSKEEALKEFNSQFIKVQYIFISTEEVPMTNGEMSLPKSEDEAKFVAQTVIDRLNSGEDFGKLIDIYSEDATMTKDAHHMIDEATSDKNLFEAAKALGFGEYTKSPVKAGTGYYVIKRFAVDENDENFSMLYEQEIAMPVYELITNKVGNMPVVTKSEKIDEYTEKWLEELESR